MDDVARGFEFVQDRHLRAVHGVHCADCTIRCSVLSNT